MQAITLNNLPYYLIQAIRLSHALMESKYPVYIPSEYAKNYQLLRKLFDIQFTSEAENAQPIVDYILQHEKPKTAIGSISRPLIFPHILVEHCKSLWYKDRKIEVSFAGLVTGTRAELISNWCQKNLRGVSPLLPNLNPLYHRILNKVRTTLGDSPKSFSTTLDKLTLWSSFRGRTFPVKAWDQEYYDLMASSKYVLCPNGDHLWSYRFYEAVLCGAMPIVERNCPAYDGYSIYTFEDNFEGCHWNEEAIHHNYDRCVRQITIPLEELNAELDTLVQ